MRSTYHELFYFAPTLIVSFHSAVRMSKKIKRFFTCAPLSERLQKDSLPSRDRLK
jgi:hypothetical protein